MEVPTKKKKKKKKKTFVLCCLQEFVCVLYIVIGTLENDIKFRL